jgi:3-oxoacyl-[acyl-carrier protein] reductase
MELGLRGKVVLVTGASRGIGRAIAEAFAEEGCRLCICARGQQALDEAAAALRERGAEVLAVAADVTQPDQVEQVVQATLARYGRIDVLVNNVGGSTGGGIAETSDAEWQQGLELNLLSSVRMSRAVVPIMQRQGGGAIIMISSIYGRESGGRMVYNAAKAAQISLTKAMARELGGQGIRVNTVAPGSILFPGGGWERRLQADPEGMAQFIRQELPYGRFGRPEEVASVVVFLASERASLVNGACIPVDGAQGRSNI